MAAATSLLDQSVQLPGGAGKYCWEANRTQKVEWLAQEHAGRGEFRHQGQVDGRRWDWKTSVMPWDRVNLL